MILKLENLTGHLINLFDENGVFLFSIGESKEHKPLRCQSEKVLCGKYGRANIYEMNYYLDCDFKELNDIKQSCDGIIVSKIVAERLKDFGYNGDIYIIGKAVRDELGRVVGTYGLSKFN